MRVSIIAALLATFGSLLSTTGVYAQVDAFNASRKMQGSKFYSGTVAPGASAKNDESAPAATGGSGSASFGSAAVADTSPNTAAARPVMNADPVPQQFNSAAANGAAPTAAARAEEPETSSGGSGLRSLQQRLNSVRKTTPTAPVVGSAPQQGAVVEQGTMVAPTAIGLGISTPPPAISSAVSTGPKEGPVAPNMPDIRVGQLPVASTQVAPVMMPQQSSTQPIVTGPVNSTRRIPVVQAPASSNSNSESPGFSGPRGPMGKISATAAENVLFSRQSPAMALETTGPKSITIGKEAAYAINIANPGEVAATDVQVSVKLPDWAEFVGAKTSIGSTGGASEQRGEPVVWRIPRLEPRSKEQLTVRLIPRESKPFDLMVQWVCSPTASQAMVDVKEPKLAMNIEGPSEVLYGQTKVYRLTMANSGTGDAENVTLFLAPIDDSNAPPTRHTIGTIAAGESKPIEVELTARQVGALAVKAMVVADGNLRAEAVEDVLVRRAGLKVAVSGPEIKFAGTQASYTITVTNPGNATAENIAVAAVLPPGAKAISGSGQITDNGNKVLWNVPALRSGTQQEIEFRCTLNTPGANRLQVMATAAHDLNDSVAANTNVEALADLKLEVTDPPGPLAVGEEMVYEVHIINRGSKAAENVDVAGFFSSGVEPVSAQGCANDISPGQVVFKPIASIAAGSDAVLKIKARSDRAGTHVFRVEVNCPSTGAKLASEETTMFYGDVGGEVRTAARPGSSIK